MTGGASRECEEGKSTARRGVGLDPSFEPLAVVWRGRVMEAVHRGAFAVVGVDGTLLGGIGDPLVRVALRSAAKPFQTSALVESGATHAFALSDEDLAVISASHVGAPEHVWQVRGLLDRAGVAASALVCGPIQHMCSGKHAGMMLLARHLGVSPEGYQSTDHPVQQYLAGYIGSLLEGCPQRPCHRGDGAGTDSRALFVGTDGCGVPVIGTTLFEAAWLYASLAAGATPALRRVRDAMVAHPTMVAGEGRLDTLLMGASSGRVAAKGGAEGVQGMGLILPPSEQESGPDYLGFFLKVEDGSARPIASLLSLTLRDWGLEEEAAAVEVGFPARVSAMTGAEVGRIEPLVEQGDVRRRRVPRQLDERPRVSGTAVGDEASGVLGGGLRLPWRRSDRVTVCRGDEKDVLRFLRDQWPGVDEQVFGRELEWAAEPHALVLRREGKIVAILKGHFIGGVGSVDELMVAEGSRGGGLGSLLLGRFEEEARRRGCSRIMLRAVKGSPAEDFYRGRGYHRECVQYGYEFGYNYVRLTCDVQEASAAATDGAEKRDQKG